MNEVKPGDVRIGLISRQGEPREAYTRLLNECGVKVLQAATIADLFHQLPEVPINGFIVDVPAVMGMPPNEKVLLHGIESIFPNVRVNWNPKAGFRALYNDGCKPGEENIRTFVNDCLTFKPRTLRKNKRKDMNLNVLLWREGETRRKAIKTFTCDISPEGAFISTSGEYAVGSTVWLVLKEVSPEPLAALVRWTRPWGKSMVIPGFGCKFTSLGENQKKTLEDLLI